MPHRPLDKRQILPPDRRSRGLFRLPDAHVIPLGRSARVTVEAPELDGVWLVQTAGTTADPTIFPPDRTLPQLAFDFRDLKVPESEREPADPFAVFRDLMADGLAAGLGPRAIPPPPNGPRRQAPPRHLVFVGHSFGGMVSADFLVRQSLDELRALVPTVERVTLVMVAAAHVSPMNQYRIRSDAPVVGPLATWLSHHVTHLGTRSRSRLESVMRVAGQSPPRSLWREAGARPDELRAVWDMPQASSLDHFWSVVQCARQYDLGRLVRGEGRRLWFDLLILSAERDTQWPDAMFDDFWELVCETDCPRARWCRFPGDDHLSVARHPVKYYKEIKDFLMETGAAT